MALERSALDWPQQRLDEIRATGDDDLAGRAWHALSQVLFDFTRAAQARVGADVPVPERVTVDEVRHLLNRNRSV